MLSSEKQVDMGMLTLETARLMLIPWSLDDIDVLHQMWTDPLVRRYLWDNEVISRQRAAATVEAAIASGNRCGIGFWLVLLKPANAFAGFCGFRFIGESRRIELLYALLPEQWGQGVATEAGRAVLDYGFEAGLFARVFGRVDMENLASIRVLERLGMHLEKEMRLDASPALVYSMLCGRQHEMGLCS